MVRASSISEKPVDDGRKLNAVFSLWGSRGSGLEAPAGAPCAVGLSIKREDLRVMDQPTSHRRRYGVFAGDLIPPAEGEVARDQQRTLLIAGSDQSEEQIRRALAITIGPRHSLALTQKSRSWSCGMTISLR